jgi:hypothetical protein
MLDRMTSTYALRRKYVMLVSLCLICLPVSLACVVKCDWLLMLMLYLFYCMMLSVATVYTIK